MFVENINRIYNTLLTRTLCFSEAYIFVLEAIRIAQINLKEIISKGGNVNKKSIEASFLELSSLLGSGNIETGQYYRSILFVDLISQVEISISDTIKEVIKIHPLKVGDIKFSLKTIIEIEDQEALISMAAEEFLYKIMYEKPFAYLSKICDILSISDDELKSHWPNFVEAKARRDLGVHNSWKCNSVYLRKVSEVGLKCDYTEGDILAPVDRSYCSEVANNILQISSTISRLVKEKYA